MCEYLRITAHRIIEFTSFSYGIPKYRNKLYNLRWHAAIIQMHHGFVPNFNAQITIFDSERGQTHSFSRANSVNVLLGIIHSRWFEMSCHHHHTLQLFEVIFFLSKLFSNCSKISILQYTRRNIIMMTITMAHVMLEHFVGTWLNKHVWTKKKSTAIMMQKKCIWVLLNSHFGRLSVVCVAKTVPKMDIFWKHSILGHNYARFSFN